MAQPNSVLKAGCCAAVMLQVRQAASPMFLEDGSLPPQQKDISRFLPCLKAEIQQSRTSKLLSLTNVLTFYKNPIDRARCTVLWQFTPGCGIRVPRENRIHRRGTPLHIPLLLPTEHYSLPLLFRAPGASCRACRLPLSHSSLPSFCTFLSPVTSAPPFRQQKRAEVYSQLRVISIRWRPRVTAAVVLASPVETGKTARPTRFCPRFSWAPW